MAAAFSDGDLRRALDDCWYPPGGIRPGLVPFNAPCVALKLAAATGLSREVTMSDLERWAQSLGGEVVEGEVLWLPAGRLC